MAALNFPNNPSLNQIYTANDTSWRWNGSSWVRVNLGTQGVQGTQGLQGILGVQGTASDTLWRQGPLGISTSENVGIATTAATAFALDVYGNARVSGILTVGSSSVIINGVNNTVNVGTSATIGTTNTFLKTSLEVTGVSTFQNNVFINGSLIAGAGGGGVSIGDDLITRNLYASGVSTFIGAIAANSATFSGNVTIGGTLKYEDVVNVDSIGIATARSGLRITGGGLDVVGVSTFANAIDANGDLDVDGHTELDNVNVSGVITATTFDGNLNALGKTWYVATTGSDTNSGNNINEPYLTIAKALSVSTNGDIINVSAGVYGEVCPLTVPRGVTVKGAGLRATTIKPTDGTKTNDIFRLHDITTVEDFTISNSYYNSSNDTGYSFTYAPGIAITTRSPYIQRITVLNTGTTVTSTDPYGYDTADSPPTSYIAGRGAKVDGSIVASNSLEAGMLFNEVTFFTPNSKGIFLTNGARAEYLNCFHYFASQAIVGTSGTVGIGSTANARIKLVGLNTTPAVNNVIKLYSGGSPVAVGTVFSFSDPYVTITGKGYGTFTSVGIGTTQDVRVFQSDGTTQVGTAGSISFADYKMFGAEMRSVGCAIEYGSQGVVADGVGVQLRLFAMNFNHVGSGKDFSNDDTLVVQANEVVELNNGQVSYVSIDQRGDFRVGDALYINQETGSVSFAATTYDLTTTGNLTVTDGVSNSTVITPTSLTVGNLQLAANTFSSTIGDITIDPAAGNKTLISGDLNVSGVSTFVGIGTFSNNLFVGGILYAPSLNITGGATLGDDLTTRNISASGIATVTGATDLNGDLDVDGHTELDNVNVSGVSTFVGIITSQNNVFVGNNLSVSGNAKVVGILTIGSSSITLDGNTNTINVGSGATIHTTTSTFNQVQVSGASTFVGVSTFKDKVVFDSTNSIRIPVGNTSQRDISPILGQIRYNSQLSTFEGYGAGNAWGSLGGVKDVDGNTYIIPETSPGANENTLYFYTDGSNTATLSGAGFTVSVPSTLGITTTTYLTAQQANISGVITATAFHTGAEGSAIRITNNTISGPSSLIIDPSAVGDNTGSVRIKGDLYVDGTETYILSLIHI